MEIILNQDQKEIARQAGRFCENELPMTLVRRMMEDEKGFSDSIWEKMAEMGWTAMLIPEEYGGLDLTLLDLCLVLQEMGRVAAPGPFFSSTVLAAETIKAAGTQDQKQKYLPDLASGKKKGALALYEADSGADPEYIALTAQTSGESHILSGEKLFVLDAHIADFLIVPAITGDNRENDRDLTLFIIDLPHEKVAVDLLPGMDQTRRNCAVKFDALELGRENILGQPAKGRPPLIRALARAQTALCADSVGGARKAMEIATEYAKTRIQFDQPIGAFQSVKHRCAQMYVEVESAQSTLYWAAWTQDQDPDQALMAASVAKAYISEVYRNTATSAIQVLGGTGFSWEHDAHIYLKRAKANEANLGDPCFHRERIMRILAG